MKHRASIFTFTRRMIFCAALSMLCAFPAQAQDITTGLTGHWKLDETSGTTAYDSTGNFDGTLVNGPEWTIGNLGGALAFDRAQDQYVDIGDVLELPLPLTMSAWVKFDELSGSYMIFANDKNDTTHSGVWLQTTDDQILVNYGDADGGGGANRRTKATSAGAVSTDSWYHIVAVVRGQEDMDIYINGVDAGGSYSGTGGALQYRTGSPAVISSDRYPLPGTVDDVRIYDRALTAPDVAALFEARNPGTIRYNETHNVPEYHNGVNWVAMAVGTMSGGVGGCSAPGGDEGQILYNTTHHVMQYCNGSDWVAMGPLNPGGGGGCTDPSGDPGRLMFNNEHDVMQYCNADRWVAVGKYSDDSGGDDPEGTYTAAPGEVVTVRVPAVSGSCSHSFVKDDGSGSGGLPPPSGGYCSADVAIDDGTSNRDGGTSTYDMESGDTLYLQIPVTSPPCTIWTNGNGISAPVTEGYCWVEFTLTNTP